MQADISPMGQNPGVRPSPEPQQRSAPMSPRHQHPCLMLDLPRFAGNECSLHSTQLLPSKKRKAGKQVSRHTSQVPICHSNRLKCRGCTAPPLYKVARWSKLPVPQSCHHTQASQQYCFPQQYAGRNKCSKCMMPHWVCVHTHGIKKD